MAATNKTSARHALMLQRQRDALEYRRGGSSYSAIGAKLEISAQRAQQLVAAALEATAAEIRTDGDALRALELERLDVAIRAIAEKVKGGDLRAIDRWLRISERRAKLLGLDAPTKVAPTDPTGDLPYRPLADLETEDVETLARIFSQLTPPLE